jgi:hypothetical protein
VSLPTREKAEEALAATVVDRAGVLQQRVSQLINGKISRMTEMEM